jgi:hypothetical protein
MQHAAVGQLLLCLTVGAFCYISLWLLVTVSKCCLLVALDTILITAYKVSYLALCADACMLSACSPSLIQTKQYSGCSQQQTSCTSHLASS